MKLYISGASKYMDLIPERLIDKFSEIFEDDNVSSIMMKLASPKNEKDRQEFCIQLDVGEISSLDSITKEKVARILDRFKDEYRCQSLELINKKLSEEELSTLENSFAIGESNISSVPSSLNTTIESFSGLTLQELFICIESDDDESDTEDDEYDITRFTP